MTATMGQPKLSCRNLTKTYVSPNSQSGNGLVVKTAVDNVSFDVMAGETFVVMGLSGCGKSTLIRCLALLVEPDNGAVLIDGADVLTMAPTELRALRRLKISMVFQHFGLLPHRTVLSNVTYPLEVQGVSLAERNHRAERFIASVGLSGSEHAYPIQLSGGMRQRVGLARALITDPDILLLDEPFSALDPLIRRDLQDELLALQESLNKTMIFITHDLAEAVKMGSRIAVMKAGALVQVGTPADVVMRPANEYVRRFVADFAPQRVIKASDIMGPAWGMVTPATGLTRHVNHFASMEQVLHQFLTDRSDLAVVNQEGNCVGRIELDAVLKVFVDTAKTGQQA